MSTVEENSGTTLNISTLEFRGFQKEKRLRKDHRKYSRDNSQKLSNMRKKSLTSIQKHKSSVE